MSRVSKVRAHNQLQGFPTSTIQCMSFAGIPLKILPRALPQFPQGIPKVHQSPLVSSLQVLSEAPFDFLCFPVSSQNELQAPPTPTLQFISISRLGSS